MLSALSEEQDRQCKSAQRAKRRGKPRAGTGLLPRLFRLLFQTLRQKGKLGNLGFKIAFAKNFSDSEKLGAVLAGKRFA